MHSDCEPRDNENLISYTEAWKDETLKMNHVSVIV